MTPAFLVDTALPPSKRMLADLRQAICCLPVGEVMMLHESRLAQDYGMSRTPVRQVLQRLAYERLVETRTGIGTVVVPLDPAERGQHFALLAAVLRLARSLVPDAFTPEARLRLALLVEPVAAADPVTAICEWRGRCLELVSGLIDDPVMADAHAALHWRVIRWRMQAVLRQPDAGQPALMALGQRLAAASCPADLLDLVADESVPDDD